MQQKNINQYFENRREEAEGDPSLEAEVRLEFETHRRALATANSYGANISEEILQVAELAGNEMANTLGGVITVDRVGFKDYAELLYLYAHEGLHKKQIPNEAVVQATIRIHGPEVIQAKAREDYAEEQRNLDEVTSRIGTGKMLQLYDDRDFTKMYSLFKYVCMEGENMEEEDVAGLFFKAFPELEFKGTIN